MHPGLSILWFHATYGTIKFALLFLSHATYILGTASLYVVYTGFYYNSYMQSSIMVSNSVCGG